MDFFVAKDFGILDPTDDRGFYKGLQGCPRMLRAWGFRKSGCIRLRVKGSKASSLFGPSCAGSS